MYTPNFCEFELLAAQGNVVPVFKKIPSDLETPVSVFLKLKESAHCCLLESVEGGEQVGRYSYIIINPSQTLTIEKNKIVMQSKGRKNEEEIGNRNPLHILRTFLYAHTAAQVPGLPEFAGGVVGFLSYDIVRRFEPVEPVAPVKPILSSPAVRFPDASHSDKELLPEAMYFLADTVVALDHVQHCTFVIVNAHIKDSPRAAYNEATERLEYILNKLQSPAPSKVEAKSLSGFPKSLEIKSNTPCDRYLEMVKTAQEHIAAGDIFQVNLSQRFQQETGADSFSIYRCLRRLNPSPYLFYLDCGPFQLIGSSPEILVRLEGDIAQIDPIAGTRRRGIDQQEDKELATELQRDSKEISEHVMLVDLARNDLGRVCEYGSVEVSKYMNVEHYSHVMHLVSRVSGRLQNDQDAFDLLQATFPAGTVTGAPKIRAMQIIQTLETNNRGIYAGAIGCFGFPINCESAASKEKKPKVSKMDLCIAIRTIVKRGKTVFLQAGAGIVADSDPQREYQECMHKAKALFEAIYLAEGESK